MNSGAHARESAEVAAAFAVDPQRGLAAGEAVRRSIHIGRNVVHNRAPWALLRTIAALLLPPRPKVARVLCDGEEKFVNAADLVPGDVIVVDPGTELPADARLVTARALIVDESILTGATTPVSKSPEPVVAEAPLPERRSMLYLGTHVVAGHAMAIVTATGDATELARMSSATEQEITCLYDPISTSFLLTAGTSSAPCGSSPDSSSSPPPR